MRLFRRASRERRKYIYVQFDPGGKVYTYNRTLSEFRDLMADRYHHTGDVPHRAWLDDDSEIVFTDDDGNEVDGSAD